MDNTDLSNNSTPADDEATEGARFSATLCFILGLLVLLPIAPEARLTMFDLAAPVLILGHWRFAVARFRGLLAILTISVMAMIVSAQVNGSGWTALAGRSYPMVALTIELIGYYIIISGSNARGRALLVLGVMVGICMHYFYPNDLRALDDPIKFLIGVPLGVGILALSALVMARGLGPLLLSATLMAAYAVFCFLAGSRSIGGVYFASALLVIVLHFVRVPLRYPRFAPLVIGLSVISAYAFTELYTLLALRGFFGARAADIAFFQSSFGSILLGGRPEIIVNLIGIQDSPLLGVGILNYPSIYVYDMINLAVYSQQDVLDVENILYHSALFGTAFESGVVAALFWAALLYRAAFVVPLLADVEENSRAFIAPLAIITIWHILYSPPIPYNRFVMAIALAFIYFVYSEWRQSVEYRAAKFPAFDRTVPEHG